jgi:hypothetical protein
LGNLNRKKLLVRPKYKQESSIKVFVEELRCQGVDRFSCPKKGSSIIVFFENGNNLFEFHKINFSSTRMIINHSRQTM